MTDATVFLIDDDASVRDSLSLVLSLKGMRTQVFASAEAFLETYRSEWRGGGVWGRGLELQQALHQRGISLPLVMLTAHGDVPTTRLAMKAGAFDFLEKPVDDGILIGVLQDAIRGEVLRRDSQSADDTARSRLARLTPREREVLDHLVQGRSQREIAAQLNISPRTVEVYKSRMMEKLQCRSLAELIRAALST